MDNDFLLNISQIIDISCVKSNHTLEEIDKMIAAARKYQFICAFALPSFTPHLLEKLKDEPNIKVGGAVGFPSGGDTTEAKVFQAKELIAMGCNELDMVMNITHLKSQNYQTVFNDIKAVVDAAGKAPVKAILEVTVLTNEEIVKASNIAVEAGVSYVKTGTGWMNKPTTVDHIRLINETIKNKAKIKAAGGIKDLDTLITMAKAGCSRFGLGLNSAISIIEKAMQY
ncbi:deoxyribose-phosphate aldolase [Petroclostridium sp. X23]|uniref:deoxyribose-phosphate aldolase n=1 Tax=Petroclostridium sp. X23 TaxID=3045146 RepID=UPI0024AD99F0|nr:deoxyribose-phosphate aldolase [Petroclostridium sp. X23]WHH57823.1 deoxyribose-phosphate aldolase [Petroclostridium sp. X23]